jgi:Helix-turn-helix domain
MRDKIQSSPPTLLRPTEAARALGLHVQTLANLRHEGRGPEFVKIGAAVRYDADALREYCEANTKTTARKAG